MAYRVVWREHATNQLAQLWLSGRDRYRIDEAMRELDEALQLQPEQVGESRAGIERVVIIEPVGCRFGVESASNIVWVEAIWRSR